MSELERRVNDEYFDLMLFQIMTLTFGAGGGYGKKEKAKKS